mmetsp:Transcript_11753/g.27901  ORF Transcript_11753/g.27901 Transcript_11753/m.27901 type:complete len:249 (+) Transcript_11753:856-1602(+)
MHVQVPSSSGHSVLTLCASVLVRPGKKGLALDASGERKGGDRRVGRGLVARCRYRPRATAAPRARPAMAPAAAHATAGGSNAGAGGGSSLGAARPSSRPPMRRTSAESCWLSLASVWICVSSAAVVIGCREESSSTFPASCAIARESPLEPSLGALGAAGDGGASSPVSDAARFPAEARRSRAFARLCDRASLTEPWLVPSRPPPPSRNPLLGNGLDPAISRLKVSVSSVKLLVSLLICACSMYDCGT